MLTAGQLVNILLAYSPETPVALSIGAEGSMYSYAEGAAQGYFVKDKSVSGYLVETELTEELKEEGYTEEDMYDVNDCEEVIILWPMVYVPGA